MNIERRYVTEGAEFRVEGDPGARRVYGVAVPWNSLSLPLWRDWKTGKPVQEKFARGAFADVLAQPGLDVVALRDHDRTRLLGRTPGTLRVQETDRGLEYDFQPPDTTDGRDVVTLLDRGDLRGSSFAFGVKSETWAEEEDKIVRTVNVVSRLLDVSVVTSPAYPASQASVRSEEIEDLQKALDAWRDGQDDGTRAAIEREAKLLSIDL